MTNTDTAAANEQFIPQEMPVLNDDLFLNPSNAYRLCEPFMVLDIETLSIKTGTTMFEISLQLVPTRIEDPSEHDFDKWTMHTYVKPDTTQSDPETVKFHHNNGLADEVMFGMVPSAIAPEDVMYWLVSAWDELIAQAGYLLDPSEAEKNVVDFMRLYIQGSDFDLRFLNHYKDIQADNLDFPWHYSCVRDTRTMKETLGCIMPFEILNLTTKRTAKILEQECSANGHPERFKVHTAKGDTNTLAYQVSMMIYFNNLLREKHFVEAAKSRMSAALVNIGHQASHVDMLYDKMVEKELAEQKAQEANEDECPEGVPKTEGH